MTTTGAPAARDLDGAGAWEWLEPDGLGGYAMGTVAGPALRRYHGLLCVATQPPTGRVMLVNGLAEDVVSTSATEALDAHVYPGTVFPDGMSRLQSFSALPWPTWRYAVNDGELVRELVRVRGRATTLLRWTFTPRTPSSSAPGLVVRPLLSGRDAHALHHENSSLDPHAVVTDGVVALSLYPGAIPGVRCSHNGSFEPGPDWYRRVRYPIEEERGLDCEEDLFCAGALSFDLALGPALLALEADFATPTSAAEIAALFDEERARRAARDARAGDDPIRVRLVAAAEAFVIEGGPAPAPIRTTVIAGYPWFTDWGRDTFIAARGLSLAFGPALERRLLLAWEPFLDGGLIPNRFPDMGAAEYNAADASLWYALCCARHLVRHPAPLSPKAGPDLSARERLSSAVRRVLEGHLAGARHGIHIDDDGLVHAADAGLQLTWMDAKVGDWVVTPRAGKPVEIQALWIAALEAAARLFTDGDPHLATELSERAAWARSSFAARYWCEERGFMYDVLDGPKRDDTLRPNQLYALGLVRPLVEPDRARRALAAVERELLVPVGLRSRARGPGYRGHLRGNPTERDGAYHEGTVWPFLLGVYADACVRVRGELPPRLLDGLLGRLAGPGLGQLPEVFDGDAPHAPRGCPAQAWTVAEAIRVHAGAVAED